MFWYELRHISAILGNMQIVTVFVKNNELQYKWQKKTELVYPCLQRLMCLDLFTHFDHGWCANLTYRYTNILLLPICKLLEAFGIDMEHILCRKKGNIYIHELFAVNIIIEEMEKGNVLYIIVLLNLLRMNCQVIQLYWT